MKNKSVKRILARATILLIVSCTAIFAWRADVAPLVAEEYRELVEMKPKDYDELLAILSTKMKLVDDTNHFGIKPGSDLLSYVTRPELDMVVYRDGNSETMVDHFARIKVYDTAGEYWLGTYAPNRFAYVLFDKENKIIGWTKYSDYFTGGRPR